MAMSCSTPCSGLRGDSLLVPHESPVAAQLDYLRHIQPTIKPRTDHATVRTQLVSTNF